MSYPASEPLRCDVKILSFDDVNVEALIRAIGVKKYNELLDHLVSKHSDDLLKRIYDNNEYEIRDFLRDKLIK